MLEFNGFFSAFDKEMLVWLGQLYPDDFFKAEVLAFNNQLETYILNISTSTEFSDLSEFNDLAMRTVRRIRNILYMFVYRLKTRTQILPISNYNYRGGFSCHKDCEASTTQ